MKLQILLFGFFVFFVNGRDIDLESFTPSPNSDSNLINYGTVRVSKVKKNHYTIAGDFELKRNIGNEKTVSNLKKLQDFYLKVQTDCLRNLHTEWKTVGSVSISRLRVLQK